MAMAKATVRLTDQQKPAVYTRNENLLVSAAAGSGKTAVLIERILSLLRDGADAASFLVVTFTNAAAAELKQRLETRLEAYAADDPILKEQLARLPLATISTLHAFCKSLLERYFEQAGLEAGFTVIDEEESERLLAQAMEAAADALYQDEAFAGRIAPLGSLDKVCWEVSCLRRFLMSQPEPWVWLDKALADYATNAADPENSPWQKQCVKSGLVVLMRARAVAQNALQLLNGKAEEYRQTVENDIILIGEFPKMPSLKPGFARIPTVGKQYKTEHHEKVQELRNQYKKLTAQAGELMLPPSARDKRRMLFMHDALCALGELVREVESTFTQLKRSRNAVDFQDLEHLALRVTEDPRIRQDVAARYAYLFVDEYQDSSAVQEALLQRIERGNNRFLVGDVKQSIYRFRSAEPTIFMNYQQKYGQGNGGKLITLNLNFRSEPGILAAVNRVFSVNMVGNETEILYDKDAALYAGKEQDPNEPLCPVMLSLVDVQAETPADSEDASATDDENDESAVTLRAAELEAMNTARLIHSLLGTSLKDGKGGTYPASFRDIVILMRSQAGLASVYLDVFSRMGIPVYAEAGGAYYDTVEVRAAVDYLTAIDNPRKDLALLGALRGPGGFTAQELALIRVPDEKKKKNLYACLRMYTTQGEDPSLREKAERFCALLRRLRLLARYTPVSHLVLTALEETGYFTACLALPYGKTREANLRALVLRAQRYDAPTQTLSDFLAAVKSARDRAKDGDTSILTQQDDVVRLMTVHKSKGLEFPIVIGAGLNKRFNMQAPMDPLKGIVSSVRADRELGLGVNFFDPVERVREEMLSARAIAEKSRLEGQAEEMRILYVLMTRPQQRLLLTAVVKGLEKAVQRWSNNAEPVCALDWIGKAVLPLPAAKPLRALLPPEMAVDVQQDASVWKVEVFSGAALAEHASAEQAQLVRESGTETLPPAPAKDPFMLPYAHPLPALGAATEQKTSVLRSVHQGEKDIDYIHSRPLFLQKRKTGLDAAEKGTAMHLVMSVLALDAVRGKTGNALKTALDGEIMRLTQNGALTKEEADTIAVEKLMAFFTHPVGQKLLAAKEIRREHPFVLRGDNGQLIQGIIDLSFDTGNGWMLVDYKTDRRDLAPEAVQKRHGPQLAVYRKAMRNAGLQVNECVVYLFENNSIVTIAEDSAI